MEILVPIAFFLFLGAVILVPIWLRERTKLSAQQLVSQALEKGQPIDPEVMKQLMNTNVAKAQQQDRPRRTLGSAVVLIALALGFAGSAYFSGDFDPTGHVMGGLMMPALILGALGFAFLILALVDYANKKKDA
jgi:Domain of unknown function (DUF6249)